MRERELEIAAAEARLASIEQLACPYCSYEIERAFLRCPSCLRRLKEPCATCGKPLDPRWQICPYCEAEVGAQAAQPARRERSSRPRRERKPAAANAAPATRPRRRTAPHRAARGGSPPTHRGDEPRAQSRPQ